ncbi:hypothetical protein PMAYCL1PPCAC_27732 [Pristionchus mayeri]|uniref:Serpentine receptor class gamma n=1 Tax=Pristionchus mayeri TaxID=1317129 RepID=A0AAN5I9D5_9BILA|nr:hypothetical protein PMAYCL1PPCAC_27732 [Pristionchus mayeri]
MHWRYDSILTLLILLNEQRQLSRTISMNTTNIIQLCYGLPGVVIYFLIIYAMRVMRTALSTSFVIMFIINPFTNILTWLNSWIMLRLKSEPSISSFNAWIDSHDFLRIPLGFLVPQFYYIQNACCLLLCIDRFTAIYSATRNYNFWSKVYDISSFFSILICILVNIISRWAIYGDNSGNAVSKVLAATLVQDVFGIVVLLSCCVLNILSLKKLFYYRTTSTSHKELSFFLISFCIFIAQVLNLVVLFILTIPLVFPASPNSTFASVRLFTISVMHFTSDLFSIGPAYYTLLLPGPIRQYFVEKIRRRFCRSIKITQIS